NPVRRRLTGVDKPDQDQVFTGLVGHWRRLAPLLTLEPHYFRLHQQASPGNGNRSRDIQAPGLRVYGQLAGGSVNYDVSLMEQRGDEGALSHRARGLTAEVGYTWREHPWRPRLSLFQGYASGDRQPGDDESNRFDR